MCVRACACNLQEEKRKEDLELNLPLSFEWTGLLSSSQSLYFLTLALIDEVFVGGGGEGRKDQYHRHPPRFLNYLGC